MMEVEFISPNQATGNPKAKVTAPTKAERERSAVRVSVEDDGPAKATARAVAGAAIAAKSRAGVPSEKEWSAFIEKILVYGSILYAWWLTHDFSDARDDDLELTDEEATSIASPWAAMLTRSIVNKQWGRSIIDSSVLLDSIVTAGIYVHRTHPALKRKMGAKNIPQSLRSDTTDEQPQRPTSTQTTDAGVVIPRATYDYSIGGA